MPIQRSHGARSQSASPNPQVWNKQRKDEVLFDVNDVDRGYETGCDGRDPSVGMVRGHIHERLVSVEDFEAAEAIAADAGRGFPSQPENLDTIFKLSATKGR